MSGGRDGTFAANPYSEPVEPGATFNLGRSAEIFWTEHAGLRLQGDDGFGGIWYIDGLLPGKYQLTFTYQSEREDDTHEVPLWAGEGHVTMNVRLE